MYEIFLLLSIRFYREDFPDWLSCLEWLPSVPSLLLLMPLMDFHFWTPHIQSSWLAGLRESTSSIDWDLTTSGGSSFYLGPFYWLQLVSKLPIYITILTCLCWTVVIWNITLAHRLSFLITSSLTHPSMIHWIYWIRSSVRLSELSLNLGWEEKESLIEILLFGWSKRLLLQYYILPTLRVSYEQAWYHSFGPFGLQRLEESLWNSYYIDPSLEQQANSLTKERTETDTPFSL